MRKRIEKGISIKPAKFGTERWHREQEVAFQKMMKSLNQALHGTDNPPAYPGIVYFPGSGTENRQPEKVLEFIQENIQRLENGNSKK